MSTHVIARGEGARAHLPAAARLHLAWLCGGLALGFLVPFLFADLLDAPKDLYYGIYAVTVAVFFVTWARSTGQALGPMCRRHWVLALAMGFAAAGVLTLGVLNGDATARPAGLDLVGAILWRGVVYGATDGLLLSAFPILAVFAIFAGTNARQRLGGKIAIGLAALLASMAMTGAYHVGYSDFRSEKVAKPVAGDVVWSLPTLVTLNPIGAPIAHVGVHVSAVLHSYETDLYLPPHRLKEESW
jgi:protein-S-isoprenylcysteine O-methyltransferase Ste14